MGLQRGQAKCELLRDRGVQNQAAPAPQPPRPPVRGGSLRERIQKGPPPAVGGGRKGLALVQTEASNHNIAGARSLEWISRSRRPFIHLQTEKSSRILCRQT